MTGYNLRYDEGLVEKLDQEYGTPFLIFDELGMRENIRRLYSAFSWLPNFKNYYAVKAHPNPYIMNILKEEGCGMDCSSLGELILSEAIDVQGDAIMFSSNNTPVKDFQKAAELGAIINFDDISHIDYFVKNIGTVPQTACCRYNPGDSKGGGNEIIGIPTEAKFGFTKEQIFEGYKKLRDLGVEKFGLHTMVMSNDLNNHSLVETAKLLLELLIELESELGIEFDFINLGGGVGIPYKPDDTEIDIEYVSKQIHALYEKTIDNASRKKPLNIVMENGRFVAGPYAQLVSKVRHMKSIYRNYVGLDSSMSDFMRPGMYDAYHHITVLGKENADIDCTYDVTGSLCENNDKFAINRKLPKVEVGDYLVLHDAGAHGYAMGFNYNAKLKCKELLLKQNGEIEMIRRAETLEDYFKTLDYKNLKEIASKY